MTIPHVLNFSHIYPISLGWFKYILSQFAFCPHRLECPKCHINHLIQCIGSPRPVSVLNLLIQREAEPRCKEYFWWGIRLPVTCLGDASHFIAWVLKPKKGRSSSWSTSSSSSSPSFLPSGLGCFVYTCQALLERIRDWRLAKANSLSKSLVVNVTFYTISDAVCLILTFIFWRMLLHFWQLKVVRSAVASFRRWKSGAVSCSRSNTEESMTLTREASSQEERPSRPPALKSRPSVPRRVSWP